MLIVALVLAVIGLAALVTAVVTSNELIAWVCIGASVIGVLLLIVDALRERSKGDGAESAGDGDEPAHSDETTVIPAVDPEAAEDYPDEPAEVNAEAETSTVAVETTDEAGSDTKPE
jgi:hypothetical protein